MSDQAYLPIWRENPDGGHNGFAVLRALQRNEYRDGLFKLPKHRLVDICMRDDEVIDELGHAIACLEHHFRYCEEQELFKRYTSHAEFKQAMARVRTAMERSDRRSDETDVVRGIYDDKGDAE